MSSTVTAWEIKMDPTAVDGRPTIACKFLLGHGQSVSVNIAPHCVPRVAMRLLQAYAEYELHLEQEE